MFSVQSGGAVSNDHAVTVQFDVAVLDNRVVAVPFVAAVVGALFGLLLCAI